MKSRYESWGRFPRLEQSATLLRWADDAANALAGSRGTTLVFGNGRSYGDSCLASDGHLLDARGLDRFLSFDRALGVITCESGVLLGEILERVVPEGWFLPVVPGTQWVTVGGAIANDIHGKNHHHSGTFAHQIESLTLVRSDLGVMECSPTNHADWFRATVGGLGLTGVIISARIRLQKIRSGWMDVERVRFHSLAEFFELSAQSAGAWPYTAAWIDCFAPQSRLGRGHFFRGRHTERDSRTLPRRRGSIDVPFTPPMSVVSTRAMQLFSSAYFHRPFGATSTSCQPYSDFLFPLDGIGQWNRLYGPSGFQQYQCVLPPETARAALGQLLRAARRAESGSFLSMMKEFGDQPSLGMLSFARRGTTLAIDFLTGKKTGALFREFDAIVAEAKGALYPAKDSRMSGAMFRAGLPGLAAFERFVDPKLASAFWKRVHDDL